MTGSVTGCPECGYETSLPRCPMCLCPLVDKPVAPSGREYETELHGQTVTVTVVPPGATGGSSRRFRGARTRKRRQKQSNLVRSGRIHPLTQEG